MNNNVQWEMRVVMSSMISMFEKCDPKGTQIPLVDNCGYLRMKFLKNTFFFKLCIFFSNQLLRLLGYKYLLSSLDLIT